MMCATVNEVDVMGCGTAEAMGLTPIRITFIEKGLDIVKYNLKVLKQAPSVKLVIIVSYTLCPSLPVD